MFVLETTGKHLNYYYFRLNEVSLISVAIKDSCVKGLLRAAIRSISSANNHQKFLTAKKSLALLTA